MKILVSGGGTGGHIYPALALIERIKVVDPTAEFLYVGTQKGLESRIVPAKKIPFKTITIQGFKRSLSLENFKTVYLFLKSIRDSKKIIKEFQPDIVIGTGGYVCGAVVYAAAKMKIPTIIHEQNSIPGVTNKFLAKYVSKICISFKDAKQYFPENKVLLTGNPRAQEVANIKKSDDVLTSYDLKPMKETVLIFGGSRGARTINEGFLEAANNLSKKPYQIIYVTGNIYYDKVIEQLKGQNIDFTNIKIRPYIDDLTNVLANVQLVVARAGATSLAEFTALGLPSVLVPSPNVTNDHQTKNAMDLVTSGAALILKDADYNGETLTNAIDTVLLDPAKQMEMSSAAQKIGIPDAADRVYACIQELTK